MSVSGLSFAERGGRLISKRGRGRTSERERVAIESRLIPSAREVFPVLRERLLESRPVIAEAHEAAWPEIVRQTTPLTADAFSACSGFRSGMAGSRIQMVRSCRATGRRR